MTDLRVSFACRSIHGRFLGTFAAVDFDGADGDRLVALIDTSSRPQLTIELLRVGSAVCGLRVSGYEFVISRHCSHEGNLCWDGFSLSLSDARHLLARLLRLGLVVEESALEGPLADLVSAIGGAA